MVSKTYSLFRLPRWIEFGILKRFPFLIVVIVIVVVHLLESSSIHLLQNSAVVIFALMGPQNLQLSYSRRCNILGVWRNSNIAHQEAAGKMGRLRLDIQMPTQ